jgi:hypothetical protein
LCSVSRQLIWAEARNDNLLVGPGTPGVETLSVGAPGRGLLRVDEQLPVKFQMGSLQQPLQPGTLLRFGSLEFMYEQLPVKFQMGSLQQPLQPGTLFRFGSLEFMSLNGSYDMVLLPPPRASDNDGRQPARRRWTRQRLPSMAEEQHPGLTRRLPRRRRRRRAMAKQKAPPR